MNMNKLATMIAGVVMCAMAHAAADKPNIIIIFNDDMGYADLGCFGSEKNKTPRIDQMAKEGRRFTDFYVTSSVCTPSRASLMTGCYPRRVLGVSGVFFPNREREAGLDPRHFTIAELLKSVGYKTFHAGKWHLGDAKEFLPTNQGFDSFYGIPYSNDMYPSRSMTHAADCSFREGFSAQKLKEIFAKTPEGSQPKGMKGKVPLMRDEECIEFPLDQTTITRRLADESIRFIEESVKAKKPFFLYLANPMPHIPLYVSPEFEGKSKNGLYGDVIEEIDFNAGRVLDALKTNGVDEDTLVIFSSDNGPWLLHGDYGGSAKPLRDGKGSTYEGGQRVPCIVRWPAKVPAGTECSEIATAMDVLPTIAAITGAELPADLRCKPDGYDIQKLMTGGPEEKTPYERFYFGGNSAVRSGDWKYREGWRYGNWSIPRGIPKPKENPREKQLFNLAEDIGEANNLIASHPEVAKRLSSLIPLSPNVTMLVFDPEPPNGTRYELEKGEVSGGASGGGRHVGNMQKTGAAVTINVDGEKGGEFEAVLGFASGSGAKCALLVNGVEQEELPFPRLKDWSTYKAVKLTVTLKPGTNKLEIRSIGRTGVNLDYLDLKPVN
jgi:arylsulfatase A